MAPGTVLASAVSEVPRHRSQPARRQRVRPDDDPRIQMGASTAIEDPPAPSGNGAERAPPGKLRPFDAPGNRHHSRRVPFSECAS
jgi:hypothetical protein